jgi:predicted GNAT family acetyltransferase
MSSKKNLFDVHAQWANRPDDERFVSLDELHAATLLRANESEEITLPLGHFTVTDSEESSDLLFAPKRELAVVTDDHRKVAGRLTNWSFGQLAARAGAPTKYLRTLPPVLAATNLAWGLDRAAVDGRDGKFLMRPNGEVTLRALTGPNYGRIWDHEVVEAVKNSVDLDYWKIPSASYQATDPRRATTLYASDRDVFVFLVDEERPIEVAGERLNRGFIVWNSETGKCVFGIKTFLYNYVCDNRIIWGATKETEIRIRHTKSGPARFLNEAAPAIDAYAKSSAAAEIKAVDYAVKHEIADDRKGVVDWLRKRGFTKRLAEAGVSKAHDEVDLHGGSPLSLWNTIQGMTASARETVPHTDRRIEIETQAGSLLDLAAKAA